MLTIQEAQHNGQPILTLSGDLTIYSAAEARTSLAGILDRNLALPELDLSGIEEIDTAGIQVLLWLKREAGMRNKALPFSYHSAAVIEVFDLLKITGLFGDPILITPPSR